MTAAPKTDGSTPLQKVFGRGMFHGLRMAGIDNPEDFVQAAKMERIEKSVSGIARKVLDAVPLTETWPASKIIGEMVRMTSSSPDFKIVMGCLSKLVDQGLVREPKKGEFQRIKPRPALAVASPAPADTVAEPLTADAPEATVATVAPTEPIDRLAGLAATLKDLSVKVGAMAKEVEDVAISVEERIQTIHADTEKLRQLHALLKSLGQ